MLLVLAGLSVGFILGWVAGSRRRSRDEDLGLVRNNQNEALAALLRKERP